MTCFVDALQASNKLAYRSHTGISIMVNSAPIVWYSKKQNTIETSTFGSEFVALCIATELVQGLCYKLRMMGVPLDGPTSMYCDNEYVRKNATIPESTLSTKLMQFVIVKFEKVWRQDGFKSRGSSRII